jgi:hypothetical protein
MNDIVAFFSRCLLYAVFVVVSKVENEYVVFSMFERVVLTCLQICVLCAAWVLYECCAFIIRSVSRPAAYDYVRQVGDAEEQADGLLRRGRALKAAAAAAAAAAEEAAEAGAEVEGEKGEAPTERAESVAAPEEAVVFESKGALRKYITQVHMVGIVLWSTMLCSDYAIDQTAFMFLLGMLLGNVATVAFKVHEKQMRASKLRVYGVYWACIGVLVSMYLLHDGSQVIEYTEEQLGIQPTNFSWADTLWLVNVLLSPLSCGCTWTFWVDSHTLLEHYPTSVYTCLLLSIPVLMSVDRAYVASMCTRYNALVTVHMFVTEPMLKFMTMYVLTLSLEVESVVDVLVVNASVSGICYVIFSSHSELFDAIVGFLITVLLLFHLGRLGLRVLREHRRTPFVVE